MYMYNSSLSSDMYESSIAIARHRRAKTTEYLGRNVINIVLKKVCSHIYAVIILTFSMLLGHVRGARSVGD